VADAEPARERKSIDGFATLYPGGIGPIRPPPQNKTIKSITDYIGPGSENGQCSSESPFLSTAYGNFYRDSGFIDLD
jgi:hypothetical protein